MTKKYWFTRRFLGTIILCLLSILVTGSAILLAKGDIFVSTQSPHKVDVIIVLGFPANPDGSPSSVMQARVDRAIELFNAQYAPNVIFSGAAVSNEYVEAEIMAKYAIESGLPASSIRLETRSTNTIENALFSKNIMTDQRWAEAIVVTSPYHTLRAGRTFEEIGIPVSVISSVEPEQLPLLERIRGIAYEYGVALYYRLSMSEN